MTQNSTNLSLELRIPISPSETDMRMVHYLLESIQQFGGPISRSAHCVLSVGEDELPRDLKKEYAWTSDYSVDFHWVDRDKFQKWKYDATGFDRFLIKSEADVVALIDADLLITGDFDKIIRKAHQDQRMLGFMAHISPFGHGDIATTSSNEWWKRIFEEGGLSAPSFDYQYSGWGLDWSSINPQMQIRSHDPNHRFGPAYFNYGFVVGPRTYIEQMGLTFYDELETVVRVIDNVYRSQIANCLAFERHAIPCETIPINYNFPLNLPGNAIRTINQDPDGENSFEDVKIFHYISGRKYFESHESVQNLLKRTDLTGSWEVFQKKLRIISDRIGET